MLPALSGAKYRIGAWFKPAADAPIGSLTVPVRVYPDSGTSTTNLWATPSSRSNTAIAPAGVWTWVGGEFIVPDTGAALIAPGFYVQATLNAAVEVSDPEARQMAGGELIVDGSITGVKMFADEAFFTKMSANMGQYKSMFVGVLTGDAISGGKIEGVNYFSPNATAVPRTQFTPAGFEVVRGTTAEPYTAASLGGESGDALLLYDANGVPFGFTGGGDLTGRTATLDSLEVGGRTLEEWFDRSPKLIARQRLGNTSYLNTLRYGTTELGLIELPVSTRAGRIYRVVFAGYINQNMASAKHTMRLRRTYKSTGNPDRPLISSFQVGQADWTIPGGSPQYVRFETLVYSGGNEYQRLLFTGQVAAGFGYVASGDTWPSEFYVEDLGYRPTWNDGVLNTGDGEPYSGTKQDPGTTVPTQSYTTTWTASARTTFQLGTAYPNDGSKPLWSGNYNNDHRVSWALFGVGASSSTHSAEVGKTITAATAGGTITGARLILSATHTYNGTGADVTISWHGSTSLPTTKPAVGTNARTSRWVVGQSSRPVPAEEWPRLQSGATRGFILGAPSGLANLSTYAQHSSALSNIRLEIDYTR